MNATARRLLTVALFLWGAYDLAHPGRGTLLDGVDLAIHETGHLRVQPVRGVHRVRRRHAVPAHHATAVRRATSGVAATGMPRAWRCGGWRRTAETSPPTRPTPGRRSCRWWAGASTTGRTCSAATGQLAHDQGIASAIRAIGVALLVGRTLWGLAAAGSAPCRRRAAPIDVSRRHVPRHATGRHPAHRRPARAVERVHDLRLVRAPAEPQQPAAGSSPPSRAGASRCSSTCCRCRPTGSATPRSRSDSSRSCRRRSRSRCSSPSPSST